MRIWTKALLTAASLLALAPAGAMAAPALDPTSYDPDGDPEQLAIGPDGFVYVALSGAPGKEIARINTDGTFTYFDLPGTPAVVGLVAGPDVAGGPNNRLWLTYNGGVVKFDPVAGTGTDHPIATLNTAQGITPDAEGNLWAVDSGVTPGLVKIAPSGVKIADVDVAGTQGRGATLGSDGRIWWADSNGSVHATSTAAPNATQDVAVGGNPQQVAAGPAGQIGYGAPSNLIGRLATDGSFQSTDAPGTDSFDVTFARDGAYWFAQSVPDKVGRLTTTGEYTQPITLPTGAFPRYLAADASNNIWVQSAMGTKKIYKITGVEPPPQPQTTDPGTGNTGGNTDGGPTVTPDTAAPAISQLKLSLKTRRVTLRLDEPGELTVFFDKKVKRGKKNVWKKVRGPIRKQAKAGLNRVAFNKFKKGTYRLRVTATDVVGNKTAKAKTLTFKVK